MIAPFFFTLSESERNPVQITKAAILSCELERRENWYRKEKVLYRISNPHTDKKHIERDY